MPVQAQNRGRGIAPIHLQPNNRWVDSTHSGCLTLGKDPQPIFTGGFSASLDGTEKITPTRIQIPDHQPIAHH
jgi:hypothetical protein